jgi:hypothetical protein
MEKARHSLDNQAFSLWPNASDHKLATDIGWLLYSTRQQDEVRIAEMISSLTGEKIGAKWKPIRTTDGSNKSKDNNSSRVNAIHLECAAYNAQEACQKLSKWYGSSSKSFPDGTKMRLVPPFYTILSSGNRQKYASLIARQSALNSRLGTCTTWEMSTNLMLDHPEPNSGFSFRQLMMSISYQVFPGTPLFHYFDKQWHSENGVTFSYLPENVADARNVVAGLLPFLKHTADPWHMSVFTTKAKLCHAASKWDHATRQVFSADESEIAEFLADDDEYNKTDEPTAEKSNKKVFIEESHIEVNVPIIVDPEEFPKMYNNDDSMSTFHTHQNTVSPASITPSKKFTPKIVSNPPSVLASSTSDSKLTDIDYVDDTETISKLSDTQSCISSIEQDLLQLHSSVKHALAEFKEQSQQQARQQSLQDATLSEILTLLKLNKNPSSDDNLGPSARDNPPVQLTVTGDSSGVAGPA